jgi:MSHA biogenesis protein MshL
MSWNDKRARTLIPVVMALVLWVGASSPAAAFDDAGWDAALEPTTIITQGDGADVRQILRSLAASIGYGLQMAPSVKGQAQVYVENVPVGRALDAVLEPLDLGYEVVDGILVVNKRGMVSRWFSFNYPVTARVGKGEFQIDARGEDAQGSGGGESGNQNTSKVSSHSIMAIWPEVMSALQTLVFRDATFAVEGEADSDRQSLNLSDGAGRNLVVNPMASLVMVTAERERVEAVADLLARFKESLHRQVAVEVRIMEVFLNKDTQTGINWDIFAGESENGSLTTFSEDDNIGDEFFQFVVNSGDIRSILQAISISGDIKTISTPRVTTLNNQKAVVRVVTEDVYFAAQVEPGIVTNGVATEPVISYTPRTVPVGVVLDVTPQVGDDQVITLNVHPTISDVVGVVESPNQDSAPVLTIRELDTVGKVRHGETLVIAGLMSERNQFTKTGVPLLKDLPLLGRLFGKTRDQKANIELVMMLTPLLLESGEVDPMADEVRARLEQRLGMKTD